MDNDLPEDIYKPEMNANDGGRAILMITGDKVEDLEFFYPYYRFIEAGYRVDVATPDGGAFKGKHDIGLKNSLKVEDVESEDYVLLYLPGGKAPASLRKDEHVLKITQAFADSGKPIAAICHGPQILAAADVIDGHQIAAWPEVKDEVEKAGATYVDAETVIDGQFITARWPADLPAHLKHIFEKLDRASESGQPTVSFASA